MSRPYNPYYDGDDPEFANYNPKKTPTVVARISDYIDGDGEMLTVEIADEEFLAVSVRRRGQSPVLTAVIGETEQVRKMAKAMIEWADDIDEARRD